MHHSIFAFNGDQKLKDDVVKRVQDFASAGMIMASKKTFDPEYGKVSPFAAIVQSSDYSILESKFGIPEKLAELYETIFMGGFYTVGNVGAIDEIGVQPFAADFFIDWLNALPVGKDLHRMPGEFISVILELLRLSPPEVFGSQPESVQEILGRIAKLHQGAISDSVTNDEWAAARKAAIQLADSLADSNHKPLASFAETAAWDPTEAPEEIASAVGTLIFQVGATKYQKTELAAISPRELSLREEVMRIIECIRASGREPTQFEINELAEVKEILSLNTPEREIASRKAVEDERANFARDLHLAFVDLISK